MRIVFDAYWWLDGPPSLRHVLRETIFAWSREHPSDELVLVTRRRGHGDVRQDLPPNTRAVATRLWPQALAARLAVPTVAKRHKADAVITQNFAARARRRASAVYLHDVLFLSNPEWFTRAERAYFSRMIAWLPRADVVFTSSSSEAQRIRSWTRRDDVSPVGLGMSTELYSQEDTDPDAAVEAGQFILTVGRINARKNLEQVIRAAIASGHATAERPLLIVGPEDGLLPTLPADLLIEMRQADVRFTGYVSEPRLRWLYANCSAFVCLSRGEGFGMPPVEAAYFGAPLIVSELPVFRETLPEGTIFVDPDDVDAAAAAIRAATAVPSQSRLPRPEIAGRHDWGAVVRQMRDLLHARLDGTPLSAVQASEERFSDVRPEPYPSL